MAAKNRPTGPASGLSRDKSGTVGQLSRWPNDSGERWDVRKKANHFHFSLENKQKLHFGGQKKIVALDFLQTRRHNPRRKMKTMMYFIWKETHFAQQFRKN